MFKAAAGDPEAFVQLYRKFYSPIEAYLAKLNGQHVSLEDLVQEVFTRVWEQRGNFRGDSSVKTYLFGIARNVMCEEVALQTKYRKHLDQARRLSGYSEPSSRQQDLGQPEQEASLQELRTSLRQAVDRLPPKYQQALRSHLIEGVSLPVASQDTTGSSEAIRKGLARALKTLGEQMKL